MSIVSLPQNLVPLRPRAEHPAAARRQQLDEVAEQFEALFLQQILKQMRKASDVLGAGNPMSSRELNTMRELYDEVLAEHMAGQRQTGIADMLVQQLGGARDGLTPAPAPGALAGHVTASLQRSGLHSLRGTWQRGMDALDSAWQSGKAGFQTLVDSVIRHESAGRIAAVSPKGARGLMQLMPDTAREMAAEIGLPFSEARLTSDGEYNKRLGSAYLSKMLERYQGHEALALAAYNAGPGKVDEWLQSHGDPRKEEISTGAWVQKIPYEETRRYTRSILNDLSAAASEPAQPAAEVVPLRDAQAALNSSADPVALPQVQRATLSTGHPSVAFAQPIRLESKEVLS